MEKEKDCGLALARYSYEPTRGLKESPRGDGGPGAWPLWVVSEEQWPGGCVCGAEGRERAVVPAGKGSPSSPAS